VEQKTVFISYRRALSKHLARSLYMDLKMNGWDVFLDVNTIDSGDFDRIILNQIGARAHFILLISPCSLERCANAGDWVLREIEEAVRLERNIVPIIEEGADFTHEMGYLPADVRAVVSKKNALPLAHFFFDAAVEMLRTRFLKTPEYITITAPPAAERTEVQRRMASVEVEAPASQHTRPRSIDLLPTPFAWIEIPNKGYSIAKYPVTNAQFAKFIEAGGYSERKWWTDAGWEAKAKGWAWNKEKGEWRPTNNAWTEPRYLQVSKWNDAEQPVVGVSWYEAVAFCLWLSDVTGEKVMLPAEDQWQYAAQGDDGREYPWGKNWDARRCNNNKGGKGIGKTTPVRQYEGKGDSPFGVVDMAGNVWEWCLHERKTKYVNSMVWYRVLRGGAWWNDKVDYFRCALSDWDPPHAGESDKGFRLALS
jgi:formylglycine-generating enzyme required for sulfatase activity